MTGTYAGNSALAPEVKERVLSTFRQTVDLYRSGNLEDTIVGCEFILKMDGLFEPAKRLLSESKNPTKGFSVDQLIPADPVQEDLAEARAAFARRDFQKAADLASAVLGTDMMNVEAQRIGTEAQERIEATPFVEQFLAKCVTQIESGNVPAARMSLEKARALDPTHPRLEEVAQRIDGGAAAPTASFVVEEPPPPAPAPPTPRPAAPSSGFVVDNPAPKPKPEAPASDFGFTFEEEPKGFAFDPTAGSSFGDSFNDSPMPGATVGDARTFDFTTASVDTTPEDREKIAGYLQQGDAAFESADYGTAIDTWSRIFLIDVTNEQASERIDKAKKKRQEKDQQVETLMIAATIAFERDDFAVARDKFQEVLRQDPSNFNAVEYMKKLDSQAAAGQSASIPPTSSRSVPDDLFDDDFGEAPQPAASSVPDAVAPKAKAKQAPVAPLTQPSAKDSKILPTLMVAAAVLILLGAGWFVYSRFFHAAVVPFQDSSQIIGDAQLLAKRGKYDQAISVLSSVKADDPQHDKALEMIADLKKKKTEGSQTVDGRPAAVVFDEDLQKAKAAFDNHDYLTAKNLYEKANSIRPLPPDAHTTYDASAQEVAKLDNARALFKEGNYVAAAQALEPMLLLDPQNKNIRQMIVDSHFDLGTVALREERDQDAANEFDNVLKSAPDDLLAKRSKEFAIRYEGQPKDLLYKIYVKYLPLR